jgi:UDP-N-acetylmuramate--L-alanine ligase
MRGLALAAQQLGYDVSGTDVGAKPPGSTWLDDHKIKWWDKSDPTHLKGVNLLIVSGGIPLDDPMLKAAEEQEIETLSYAEFVGQLAKDKRRIVVAGTHGKTTTTSLITWILEKAGKSPDFLIGIQPRNFDTSVRLTDSRLMVLEGDEYMSSPIDTESKFAYYEPDVLIATSLEMDHPDLFRDIGDIVRRFNGLVSNMPHSGHLYFWTGAPHLKAVAERASCEAESYGERGQWHADHIQYRPEGLSFDLYEGDAYRDHFQVPLYGAHNVDNATVAIAAAIGEGVKSTTIQESLTSFEGAARRFQLVSKPHAKAVVVDDYAHHPTEIAATIEAAKAHFSSRVIAIVRPHTYSRTKELLPEYRRAVALADEAFIAEIEGAREANLAKTVSGADIARDNGNVVYEPDRKKLVEKIVSAVKPGDIVLSMTVGGYDNLAEELAEKLQ